MRKDDLCFLAIAELSGLIKKKEVSPVEVTEALLGRIDKLNPRLNAYITILKEQALRSAKNAQEAIKAGKYIGPLHGIPIAVKDLFNTKGVRTTSGSKILANYIPTEDATVVQRLSEAGAILLGKLNMHEFAFGATNENPHYGPTRNPYDTERISGGSSGGSGVATAASLCMGSLGTDTGGSIRIPASLCRIVGLKPTYGRVSCYGVTTLSWSLDHIGPMTKSVEDAALMLQVIAGWDPKDATSAVQPVPDYLTALRRDVTGLKLGIPKAYFFDILDGQVERAVMDAAKVLEKLGASIEEITIPYVELSRSAAVTIVSGEATSYHEEYLATRPEEYGPDVRMRLETGRFVLAKDYVKALRFKRLFREEVERVMKTIDAIVTPTTPIAATKIGETTVKVGDRTEEVRALLPRLTTPFNMSSMPAISVPCGLTSQGLPIGLQIVGKPFDEPTVLSVAYAYEQNQPGGRLRPPE